MLSSLFIFFSAVLIGGIVGRFMVIVVDYLPQILLDEGNQEREPSEIFKIFFEKPRCFHCQHPLSWEQNFPVVRFFLFERTCPHCQTKMRTRSFLLEGGTALLFGISVLFFPLSLSLFYVLFASCILICCFVTDYEHFILPDQFTLTLLWAGLIASLFPIFVPPREAIIGAVGGYGIFWLFNAIYYYFRGFDGMFPGDFKLNAAIGACLGIKWLFVILIISTVFLVTGTVVRIFYGLSNQEQSALHEEAPYGCYSSGVTIAGFYLMMSGISF